MDEYEKGKILGTGTFASVFLATHKKTGQLVAIKKINITDTKEGVHVTALREMKLLRELRHPNIISLLDVFPMKKNIGLVLEFMESDLEAVIKARDRVLGPGDVKAYMAMILRALHACHSHWVVHRDVKPNNCLLAPDGTLKLADFGLARTLASPQRDVTRPYTNQVFARWYRAPELFFGASSYGFAIDIWAAGCILAELLLRRPWLPGTSDIDQLGKIFKALGTPTEECWPGVTSLPSYLEFQKVVPQPLRAQLPQAPDDALALLADLVSLDPRKRPTAQQALQHSYFSNDPQPTPVALLPRLKQSATMAPSATGLQGVQGAHGLSDAARARMTSAAEELGHSAPPSARPVASSPAGRIGAIRPPRGSGLDFASRLQQAAASDGDLDQDRGPVSKRARVAASPGWDPHAAGKFSPPVGAVVRS
ncbi:kinase-like domain-containing protein [Haematococcus lacustris]